MNATPSVIAEISAALAEMDAVPDRELGGPAAADARRNARSVAEQLKTMALKGEDLPRHGGKPSPGKLAALISDATKTRFNRQLFSSNEWCARLLALFGAWEDGRQPTAIAAAQAASTIKEPSNQRMRDLEAEVVVLQAENRQLRTEISHLRDFVATTGRLP